MGLLSKEKEKKKRIRIEKKQIKYAPWTEQRRWKQLDNEAVTEESRWSNGIREKIKWWMKNFKNESQVGRRTQRKKRRGFLLCFRCSCVEEDEITVIIIIILLIDNLKVYKVCVLEELGFFGFRVIVCLFFFSSLPFSFSFPGRLSNRNAVSLFSFIHKFNVVFNSINVRLSWNLKILVFYFTVFQFTMQGKIN